MIVLNTVLLLLGSCLPVEPVEHPGRSGAPSARSDALDDLRAELGRAFEELAASAQKRKLYLQRDRLYESLLAVDPDHAAARRALGYKRDDSGGWVRGRYKRPKDRGGEEGLAALSAERVALAAGFSTRLAPLVADLDAEARVREVAPYLLLDRQDPGLNELLGRVRDSQGRWRDAAELAQEERREELAAAVRRAFDAVPEIEDWAVEPPGDGVGIAWTGALRTDRVRICGSGAPDEVRRAVEVAHASDDFLQFVLPPPAPETYGRGAKLRVRKTNASPMYRRFVAYLLADAGEIPDLLAGWPELTAEQLELFPQLSTAFLDERNSIGVWDVDERERLDALTRQLVGAYLRDHFGVSTRQGWAWEGLGLYLTHHLVGTRLTFFVRPTEYVQGADVALDERLLDPDANWIAELVRVASEGRRPKLAFVLGKDVNSMDVRDLLLSNALAAWLVETRPRVLPAVLAQLGEGRGSAGVLERALGTTLPDLEDELYAWAATR